MMGFWEHINQELKRAVEEGWTAVKESAKIGKLRLNIHNLHKDAEKHFKDIGGLVYEMAVDPSENPLHKPEVQRHIGEIKKKPQKKLPGSKPRAFFIIPFLRKVLAVQALQVPAQRSYGKHTAFTRHSHTHGRVRAYQHPADQARSSHCNRLSPHRRNRRPLRRRSHNRAWQGRDSRSDRRGAPSFHHRPRIFGIKTPQHQKRRHPGRRVPGWAHRSRRARHLTASAPVLFSCHAPWLRNLPFLNGHSIK